MDVFDVGINSDDTLKIVNGDFQMVESTLQHQKDIIRAAPGDYRQAPFFGVGIYLFLNSDASQTAIKQKIRENMTTDQMQVKTITFSDEFTIETDAHY